MADIDRPFHGAPMKYDRKFVITTPQWTGWFTEYNQEITGWTPEIATLGLDHLYGMRPWPIFDMCAEHGWKVEEAADK